MGFRDRFVSDRSGWTSSRSMNVFLIVLRRNERLRFWSLLWEYQQKGEEKRTGLLGNQRKRAMRARFSLKALSTRSDGTVSISKVLILSTVAPSPRLLPRPVWAYLLGTQMGPLQECSSCTLYISVAPGRQE